MGTTPPRRVGWGKIRFPTFFTGADHIQQIPCHHAKRCQTLLLSAQQLTLVQCQLERQPKQKQGRVVSGLLKQFSKPCDSSLKQERL